MCLNCFVCKGAKKNLHTEQSKINLDPVPLTPKSNSQWILKPPSLSQIEQLQRKEDLGGSGSDFLFLSASVNCKKHSCELYYGFTFDIKAGGCIIPCGV